MPTFQVTCEELVEVDRTYEIEAESASDAWEAIRKSQGDAGELMDEQMQGTHAFCRVKAVHDEYGVEIDV